MSKEAWKLWKQSSRSVRAINLYIWEMADFFDICLFSEHIQYVVPVMCYMAPNVNVISCNLHQRFVVIHRAVARQELSYATR